MYGNQWFETTTPESVGIASKDIESFLTALHENQINTQGFMLLRYNKLFSVGVASPYRYTDKRHVYSISKSFTSTAIGMAVDEGLISLEDKVLSFFPQWEPKEPSQNLKEMRVRHLLCMGSGHAEDTTLSMVSSSGNWVKAFLSLPVEHTPGTYFVYNSGASYILSAILQKVTEKNLVEFLTPRLFEPLNITDIVWDKSPQNICLGGWGLHLSMEDMAKLGLLYLNKGVLGSQRLLSEQWVKAATSSKISNASNQNADWQQGYCYQFWRCQHNCYRGDGAYGQFMLISPDTPLESSPSDNALLKLKTGSMICNIIEQTSVIHRSYHQLFAIEANPFNIEKIALNVQNHICFITLQSTDGRSFEIGCEKNKWTYITEKNFSITPVSGIFDIFKNSDATVAIAYYWENSGLLIVKMQFVDSPHAITFRLHLSEDDNTISAQKSTDPHSNFANRKWRLTIL